MPEIKHRLENSGPEIEYAEIHIPDDRDLGTGSFKTVIKRGVLSTGKAISSIMFNPPVFQISLNLNPSTGEIPVLLGLANGSGPVSKKIYLFPENVSVSDSHEFVVTFKKWEITGLFMDKILPRLKEGVGAGGEVSRFNLEQLFQTADRIKKEEIVTDGLLPPGAPIPEHEGSLAVTVPSYRLPKDIQEKILDDIFDLSKYFTFYQVNQGNTELSIYRNTDFQFVYRQYNPTFGEREIRIDFADAERTGAKAFYLGVTWSSGKNAFYVGLIHSNPKFEPLRQGFVLSQDKLKLIKENIEALEEILKEL